MKGFPIDAAVFSGFRLIRDRPLLLASVAVLELLRQILALTALVEHGVLADLTRLSSMTRLEVASAADALAPKLAGAFSVILAPYVLLAVVIHGAVLRAILRPTDKALAYIRLGMDELRIFVIRFGLGAIAGLIVVVGLAPGRAGLGFIGFLAGVGGLALAIVLLVRLSLAAPQSFMSRRMDFIGSWKLTEGRLGLLFATYALLFVMVIVLAILAGILGALLTFPVDALTGAAKSDPSSIQGYFTPAEIVNTLLQSVASAVASIVMLAPTAWIYRRLADQTGEPD